MFFLHYMNVDHFNFVSFFPSPRDVSAFPLDLAKIQKCFGLSEYIFMYLITIILDKLKKDDIE